MRATRRSIFAKSSIVQVGASGSAASGFRSVGPWRRCGSASARLRPVGGGVRRLRLRRSSASAASSLRGSLRSWLAPVSDRRGSSSVRTWRSSCRPAAAAIASTLVIGSSSSSPASAASFGSTGARYTTSCRNTFSATVQMSCTRPALRRVFRQLPRLGVGDVLVRPIGQLHDRPHGPIVVARFVRVGDLVARRGRGGKQAAVVGIRRRQARSARRTAPCGSPGSRPCRRGRRSTFAANSSRFRSMSSSFGVSFDA